MSALPFTPFRQLTGRAPAGADSRELMMRCDAQVMLCSCYSHSGSNARRHREFCDAFHVEIRWQIPSVVDAPDFDLRNPKHMQAFEEEMTGMMSIAMARQAKWQRAQYHEKSDHRKLSLREIELAGKGLSVPDVRRAISAGST